MKGGLKMKIINSIIGWLKSNNGTEESNSIDINYMLISPEEVNMICKKIEDITTILSLQVEYLESEASDRLITSLKVMTGFVTEITENEYFKTKENRYIIYTAPFVNEFYTLIDLCKKLRIHHKPIQNFDKRSAFENGMTDIVTKLYVIGSILNISAKKDSL